ncbi:hypothetical protein R6Q59_030561 [Mikania micrantha]
MISFQLTSSRFSKGLIPTNIACKEEKVKYTLAVYKTLCLGSFFCILKEEKICHSGILKSLSFHGDTLAKLECKIKKNIVTYGCKCVIWYSLYSQYCMSVYEHNMRFRSIKEQEVGNFNPFAHELVIQQKHYK